MLLVWDSQLSLSMYVVWVCWDAQARQAARGEKAKSGKKAGGKAKKKGKKT